LLAQETITGNEVRGGRAGSPADRATRQALNSRLSRRLY
jgi:hypothetical protein